LSVQDALTLAADAGVIEVYVGWSAQPVRVSSRPHAAGSNAWQAVSLLLRQRVASAIQPLLDDGWTLEGTPVAAMRWDTTYEHNGQDYEGCWVRLRSRLAVTTAADWPRRGSDG
jgi:hypothetical protein